MLLITICVLLVLSFAQICHSEASFNLRSSNVGNGDSDWDPEADLSISIACSGPWQAWIQGNEISGDGSSSIVNTINAYGLNPGAYVISVKASSVGATAGFAAQVLVKGTLYSTTGDNQWVAMGKEPSLEGWDKKLNYFLNETWGLSRTCTKGVPSLDPLDQLTIESVTPSWIWSSHDCTANPELPKSSWFRLGVDPATTGTDLIRCDPPRNQAVAFFMTNNAGTESDGAEACAKVGAKLANIRSQKEYIYVSFNSCFRETSFIGAWQGDDYGTECIALVPGDKRRGATIAKNCNEKLPALCKKFSRSK